MNKIQAAYEAGFKTGLAAQKDSVIPPPDQIDKLQAELLGQWNSFATWYSKNIRAAGVLEYVRLFDEQEHFTYSQYTDGLDEMIGEVDKAITAASDKLRSMAQLVKNSADYRRG